MAKRPPITNRVKELRAANGDMSQAALAEAIGVTRQTVIAIEQGLHKRRMGGEVVRRFEPFAMDAGSESFTWNGEMDSGEEAPKGSYTVSVEASADGEPLEVVNLNYAMVSGVSLDDNGAPLLDLGGVSEQVSLGDIRQIL